MPIQELSEVEKQIEAGYDYRGHVTIIFQDGKKVEGFLYNRQFKNPKLPEDNFIEVFLKGDEKPQKYSIASVQSVELTGEDCAALNPYIPPKKKASLSESA
jgi:hypothetical protein